MVTIDPATLKIILHAAFQMLEDEEARKRLLYIISIPIVLVVLLACMIQYVFTAPLNILVADFGDNFVYVQQFFDEYGTEFDEYGFWRDNEYLLNNDYELLDYSQYDAFDAELFAKLMNEATKHIGLKYDYGGNSPVTGFDCSSYICWIFTKSGVYNLSRTTAQGIYNQCAVVPRSEAKAGDLIFFTKTYDIDRTVTHIGLYLGDGTMLHCGSPIGYADIDSSYWSRHFYAFGRLPVVLTENTDEGE